MDYVAYEERGNVKGASYQLVQTLPDGSTRVINLNEHALATLDVHKTEWKES